MAAVLALLFITLIAVLAVGLYATAGSNTQAASRHAQASSARAAADSALEWAAWRFAQMPLPLSSIGNITPDVALDLWPAIRTTIINDLQPMASTGSFVTWDAATSVLSTQSFRIDDSDTSVQVQFRQHPIPGDPTPLDARHIRVTAIATNGLAERRVSADFKIDKRIRYAVVSKTRIQIGRNVLVEGPMGMSTANRTPPYLILSDFEHLATALRNRIRAFQAWCETHRSDFDNRVRVGSAEYAAVLAAGYDDVDLDGYVDEFDLFVDHYDNDGDGAISLAEFTDPVTGKLYDQNLFKAIDELGAPLYGDDVTRYGFADNKLDRHDGYAKTRGQISMAISQAGFNSAQATGGLTIFDNIRGTVIPDRSDQAPVKFNASDIFDLNPLNFEQCAANYRARSGTAAGTPTRSAGLIANTTLSLADANGTPIVERTPFGSTSYQATYRRPVFRNLTLRNVIIPKGMNALFDNCTFEGVTFIDSERNITTSSGSVSTDQGQGMSWAQRKVSGDNFSKDKQLIGSGTPTSGQTVTRGSQLGNNIRFHNCTIKGPLANNYATAYTHFANSWEFTGATLFDNQTDDTATIVAPQTNIEMGSFTNPGSAPSTLIGVVVAGNIDIRGTSVVDGSIIVTGDGAGNTTLGYFGASDSDTNPSAMPEGGFGRLNLRYNPHRPLPDGINIRVNLSPLAGSYREGE
jgi:hypothetical protein